MPKKYAISAIAIVILALGAILLNQGGKNPGPTPPVNPPLDSNPAVVTTPSPEAALSPAATIIFNDNGFNPNTISIRKGDTVTFKNASSLDFWPASDPHPIHTGYPTKGGCISSTFDACKPIPPGSSWSFKFDVPGTWGYHDHLRAQLTGKIIVQ